MADRAIPGQGRGRRRLQVITRHGSTAGATLQAAADQALLSFRLFDQVRNTQGADFQQLVNEIENPCSLRPHSSLGVCPNEQLANVPSIACCPGPHVSRICALDINKALRTRQNQVIYAIWSMLQSDEELRQRS
ncbi:hypothetical protein [Streptomyces sp. NPDC005930]|uniref:hypothetical protein n=1 Tax=Streptomyces sp. NPDC005930 TaxID=3364736 RepID=UPI0036CB92CC